MCQWPILLWTHILHVPCSLSRVVLYSSLMSPLLAEYDANIQLLKKQVDIYKVSTVCEVRRKNVWHLHIILLSCFEIINHYYYYYTYGVRQKGKLRLLVITGQEKKCLISSYYSLVMFRNYKPLLLLLYIWSQAEGQIKITGTCVLKCSVRDIQLHVVQWHLFPLYHLFIYVPSWVILA